MWNTEIMKKVQFIIFAILELRKNHSDPKKFRKLCMLSKFSIDYTCEDGRFLVLASCVTISNLDQLYSSETGVNPGIRS